MKGVQVLTILISCLLINHGHGQQPIGSRDLVKVIVTDAQYAVIDRDSSSQANANWKDLKHQPSTDGQQKLILTPAIDLDDSQKLSIRFSLKDSANNNFVAPHQVFVVLAHKASEREIIFMADEVAEGASSKEEPAVRRNFKFDLIIGGKKAPKLSQLMSGENGVYDISIIVGDNLISNSFIWNLLSANINFGSSAFKSTSGQSGGEISDFYKPKKEINHIFRTPEKRPPFVVSDLFAILVTVLPFLTLVIVWSKIGVNLKGFQLSLSSLIFHSSLGLIFGLYFMFWLEFNMFTTLKFLLALAVIAFMSGHSLLSKLHAKNNP